MNVWKSIIIGLMGIWLLAGCSGNGEGSLREYFSKIELYRVCADRDEGLHDELNMNEAGG